MDSVVCSLSPSLSDRWLGFVLWRSAALWWWVWYGYFAWWVHGGLWWCGLLGLCFFFFGGGFTSGGVVCSAAVVEWGCWGFLFCFDFLWWVLWLMVVAFDLWLIFCCGMCGFDGGRDGFVV